MAAREESKSGFPNQAPIFGRARAEPVENQGESWEAEVPEAKNPLNNVTIGGAGIGDQPAPLEADQLGFKPYIEAIFSFLNHQDTKAPFTLSIEGDWGCGKSSFMLQLEQALKKNHQRTIRFNAWRHDKVEAMWAAFALSFISQLSHSLVWYKRIIAHFKLNWSRFDIRKGWLSVLWTLVLILIYSWVLLKLLEFFQAEDTINSLFDAKGEFNFPLLLEALGGVGLCLGMIFLLKRVSDIIGNPFSRDLKKYLRNPDYRLQSAFIEEFHEDFDRAVTGLTSDNEKVFVFIDDLDRAEVPKSAELMHGLNMMISNSDRLVFILGMDREKVAAGIAAKYKDILPFMNPKQSSLDTEQGINQALDFGYSFVEKFIQLSFRIPQPSPDFIKSFIASLGPQKAEEKIGQADPTIHFDPILLVDDGQDAEEFKQIIEAVAPFFDYNPRRLKQYVNTFRLKAHIAHSTGLFKAAENELESLTITRLGKFVAIILKWPQITEDLIENPLLFQRILSGKKDLVEKVETKEYTWASNASFMQLLKLVPHRERPTKYSIAEIDVLALLRTSPSVTYSTRQATGERSTLNFETSADESYKSASKSRKPFLS